MDNNKYPILNKDFNFLKHLDKPDTLNYEWSKDKQAVAMNLTKAIFKAAAVMGISLDSDKASFTIQEVVLKIGKDYPLAYIDDIAQAIEMASFGEIKLENQLNTISAHNIYGWYVEFRANHFHKSSRTMYHKYLPKQTELTEEDKQKQMLESFIKYIDQPTDLGVLIYYEIFEKIGAIPKNLYDSRTDMFLMEAQNFAHAIPAEMLMNGEWRRQAYAYSNYVKALAEGQQFDYKQWKDNILHRRVIERCKRFLVMESIKRSDRETLIDLYKKHYGMA